MRTGERHLARPPDVLDREPACAIVQQANDVDPYLVEPDPVCDQPPDRQLAQPGAFHPPDRLERRAVPRPRPGLHLAHDERLPLHRDDVDLAFGTPPVAVQNPETVTLEIRNRGLLAVPAEHVFRAHRHHLRNDDDAPREWRPPANSRLWRNS